MDPRHLHSWTLLGDFLQSCDNGEPEPGFLGTDVITGSHHKQEQNLKRIFSKLSFHFNCSHEDAGNKENGNARVCASFA